MTRPVDDARGAMVERMALLTGRDEVLAVHLRGGAGRQDADSEDLVSHIAAYTALEGLGEAALQEIQQIQAALKRIDEGVFGVCAACGNDIPPGRLEALPHDPLCAACAGTSPI